MKQRYFVLSSFGHHIIVDTALSNEADFYEIKQLTSEHLKLGRSKQYCMELMRHGYEGSTIIDEDTLKRKMIQFALAS